MKTVIDEYIDTLEEPEKQLVSHMYVVAREVAPHTTEELSYAMPALKYKSKGLLAVMSNKKFLSAYPFGSVKTLGIDLSGFELTDGSIHFSVEKPIPDTLLREIVTARMHQIDQKANS